SGLEVLTSGIKQNVSAVGVEPTGSKYVACHHFAGAGQRAVLSAVRGKHDAARVVARELGAGIHIADSHVRTGEDGNRRGTIRQCSKHHVSRGQVSGEQNGLLYVRNKRREQCDRTRSSLAGSLSHYIAVDR